MISNADDFGLSASVNEAIAESFKLGYINQTTAMVNMPYFDKAVKLSYEKGFNSQVGIHINLDTGFALSDAMRNNRSFCNEDGQFNNAFFKNRKNLFFISKQDKNSIREELKAQFTRYKDAGFDLLHFDSHHHIHNNYSLLLLIIPIAKEFGFKSTRLCRNIYIKKPAFVKRIYKATINHKIKQHFAVSDYFGSYADYVANRDKLSGTFEIMLHPDKQEGQLVDIINPKLQRNMIDYDIKFYTKG